MTGTVKGYEIKSNRNSEQKVLMLQVAISSDDDIQSVEYMTYAGDNSIPPIGSIVNILQAGKAWKIAIASNDKTDFDDSLSEGDRLFYSKDRAATYKIGSDGTHVFNDGTIKAARNSDPIQSSITDDSTFWTWISAAGAVLAGLGVVAPIPSTLTGKITDGTDEVLLP